MGQVVNGVDVDVLADSTQVQARVKVGKKVKAGTRLFRQFATFRTTMGVLRQIPEAEVDQFLAGALPESDSLDIVREGEVVRQSDAPQPPAPPAPDGE